ncbi:MAG: nucleotidyltransferase domain-containing protein [Betaproteobacteria bacterium]|nr:nucleotidyltransferase domain-containing protein [Betaproteobacteria bacterium]
MNEEAILKAVGEYLAERADGNIVAAYVFGNVARRTSRPSSDVDIGVLYAAAPPPTLGGLPVDLEDDLQRSLGCPVQIVTLNKASADLVHRVLRDGELVFETDRSTRIRFEVRSRQVYLDLLPVRRQYRHGIKAET